MFADPISLAHHVAINKAGLIVLHQNRLHPSPPARSIVGFPANLALPPSHSGLLASLPPHLPLEDEGFSIGLHLLRQRGFQETNQFPLRCRRTRRRPAKSSNLDKIKGRGGGPSVDGLLLLGLKIHWIKGGGETIGNELTCLRDYVLFL